VGSKYSQYIAGIDISSASVVWSPNVNAVVYSMAYTGGQVVIAGSFYVVNGENRSGVLALDATTAANQALPSSTASMTFTQAVWANSNWIISDGYGYFANGLRNGIVRYHRPTNTYK
jgi:hypothetical protein